MIRNVILTILLFTQVTVWMIVDSPFSEEKEKSQAVAEHKLEPVLIDQTQKIELIDADGTKLILARRNANWVLESFQGYPSDPGLVEQALDELRNLHESDFRTDETFLHEDLSVDMKHGRLLRLYGANNRVLLKLVIGKRDTQGSGGTFIRLEDSPEVFVSRSKTLFVRFTTDTSKWYDMGSWDFKMGDEESIMKLRSSAYRLEAELEIPGNLVDPKAKPDLIRRRWAMERIPKDLKTQKEAHWKVVEPAEISDIELKDIDGRSLVRGFLNARYSRVVGPEKNPEYFVTSSDDAKLAMKVYFRDSETKKETIRELFIGSRMPPGQSMGARLDYMRTTHPGNPLRQNFVYGIDASFRKRLSMLPENMRNNR